MALGASCPLLLMLAVYGAAGALEDLYLATITYNLQYSGETYASRWHMVQYLVTFPVRQARLDSLWMLGGAGTALLLAWSGRHRPTTVATAWVAAACLGIAINGSRGLPQYFVQVGGGVDAERTTFGRLAAKVPARRVHVALERLVRLYADEKEQDETAVDFFRRVEIPRVKALLSDLETLTAGWKPVRAGPAGHRSRARSTACPSVRPPWAGSGPPSSGSDTPRASP